MTAPTRSETDPALAPVIASGWYPLLDRFPQLRSIPRVPLCTLPSPVRQVTVDGVSLWIKDDGANAPECGGNKARALELLLAGVRAGDTVLTVGGEGSTHVLSTAVHAARLGARTIGVRWRHDMNPTANRVAARIRDVCSSAPVYRSSVEAILRASILRLMHRVHYVPLGGSVPRGVLAQVNAGLELAEQIRMGVVPKPERIVIPLGSGGTFSGIALGLSIARVEIAVIGVQVAPVIVANRFRVRRLIRQTARTIERATGERVVCPPSHLLGVTAAAYGGAYGRTFSPAVAAATALEDVTGIRLDYTYSAKAFVVALDSARRNPGTTLFWNTFDGRVL